ncbi:hypothetical protein CF319_g3763 [Tilletia indica]|nr:hypothetical protein CF319_g3763 [Tilletia indica]
MSNNTAIAPSAGASPDPPGSRPAAAPNILPANHAGVRLTALTARRQHKRARPIEPDDSDEDVSRAARLVPAASTRQERPQATTSSAGAVARTLKPSAQSPPIPPGCFVPPQ